jgi:hypothetical protein
MSHLKGETMKVRINTSRYSRTHGRPPAGFGGWAFDMGGEVVAAPGPGHYTVARQWAKLEAKRRGLDSVSVAP